VSLYRCPLFYPCDDSKINHTLPHSEFNVEYFYRFQPCLNMLFMIRNPLFQFISNYLHLIDLTMKTCRAFFYFCEYIQIYVATLFFSPCFILSPVDEILLDGRTRTLYPLKSPGVQCGDGWGVLLIHIENLIFLYFFFYLMSFLLITNHLTAFFRFNIFAARYEFINMDFLILWPTVLLCDHGN